MSIVWEFIVWPLVVARGTRSCCQKIVFAPLAYNGPMGVKSFLAEHLASRSRCYLYPTLFPFIPLILILVVHSRRKIANTTYWMATKRSLCSSGGYQDA